MHRLCPNCAKAIGPLAFLRAAVKGKTIPEAPGVLGCPHCGHIIATALVSRAWATVFFVGISAVAAVVLIYAQRNPQLGLALFGTLFVSTAITLWLALYFKTPLNKLPRIFLALENGALRVQSRGYPLPESASLTSPEVRHIKPEDIERVRLTEGYLAIYLKPASASVDIFFQPALQQRITEFFSQHLPMVRIEVENAAAP